MKHQRSIRKTVSRILELPQDLDPHLVQITWVGRSSLLIEQHRGIIGFEPHRIRLLSEQGTLCVTGNDMQLCELSQSRAFLEGDLIGISFEDES